MKYARMLCIVTLGVLGVIAVGYGLLGKKLPPTSDELASRKTVEDYFMEHLRVSAPEAKRMAAEGTLFRLGPKTTVQGVIGNLYYYSFIDDEVAFEKLLRSSKDTTPGNESSIRIGTNTIDVSATYSIDYSMSDAELADTLLNKGHAEELFSQYSYLFMPGKDQQ